MDLKLLNIGRPLAVIALAAVCLSHLAAGSARHAAATLPRDGKAPTRSLSAHISTSSLRAAVQRIPGYRSHRSARWRVSSRYPYWGVTNWYHNTVYISPTTPSVFLDSVVRHEWSHILEARDYHGDVGAAVISLNRHFGGGGRTGIHGAEVAADCMARELGATWTHYTSCSSSRWRHEAAVLVHGYRLH